MGSADTSFTVNYPRRTFQPINPAHNIKLGAVYNEIQSNPSGYNEELYRSREDSSGSSSDSQYSHSSNPTSIDSHDVDMNTPLHGVPKQNYVSKHVYI